MYSAEWDGAKTKKAGFGARLCSAMVDAIRL
jgi:hypothetical protein